MTALSRTALLLAATSGLFVQAQAPPAGWLISPIVSRMEATSFGLGFAAAQNVDLQIQVANVGDPDFLHPIKNMTVPRDTSGLERWGMGHFKLITISGLNPDTQYWLRVSGNTATTSTQLIRTALPAGSTQAFKFVALGDTQGAAEPWTNDGWSGYGGSRAHHRAVTTKAAAENARFTVHLGDLTATPSTPFVIAGIPHQTSPDPDTSELFAWFEDGRALYYSAPVVPVWGNHDWWGCAPPDNAPLGTNAPLVMPWMQYWLGKPLGTGQSTEYPAFYSHDYGNVHLCAISSGPYTDGSFHNGPSEQGISPTQLQWIESDLKAAIENPNIKHIFVALHRPVYSGLSNATYEDTTLMPMAECFGDNQEYITKLVPLFKKYKVKLVLAGHVHSFQHRVSEGIDYIVTGGGGGPYSKGTLGQNTAAQNKLYFEWLHYVTVEPNASGSSIRIRTTRVNGPDWYDSSQSDGSSLMEEFWIGPGLAPGAFTATNLPGDPKGVRLTWSKAYSNADALGSVVKLEAKCDNGSWISFDTVGANQTSISTSGLWSGTWRFRAQARDIRDDYSPWAESGPVVVLQEPGNVTASALRPGANQVTWTSTDSNATTYEVHRSVNSGGWSLVGSTSGQNRCYTDLQVPCGAGDKYNYRVRAKTSATASQWSGSNQIYASSCYPFDVYATAVSHSRIDLTWSDTSNRSCGFLVQRALASAPNAWATLATLPSTGRSYCNTGLASATAYLYRIAYNSTATHGISPVVGCTTLQNAPTNFRGVALAAAKIQLTWDDVADENGYRLERRLVSPSSSDWGILKFLNANTTTFSDQGLIPGQSYQYRLTFYQTVPPPTITWSDATYLATPVRAF